MLDLAVEVAWLPKRDLCDLFNVKRRALPVLGSGVVHTIGCSLHSVREFPLRPLSNRDSFIIGCDAQQLIVHRVARAKDIIGHIHTAGNPGRNELDDTQEINYPPIMRKLLEIGYDGYVGQEFIPTRDPLAGLREAVALCDV